MAICLQAFSFVNEDVRIEGENNSPKRAVPQSMLDGPNCFTTALLQTEYLNYLRGVTHSEFKLVNEIFFDCKEVKNVHLIKFGNLGTVYLNSMPIHAFTMLDTNTAYEKDDGLATSAPRVKKDYWDTNFYCKRLGVCKLGSNEISTHVNSCKYKPTEELLKIKEDFNEAFLVISKINTSGEINQKLEQYIPVLENLYLSVEAKMATYSQQEIFYSFVLLKSLNHQLYAYLKPFTTLESMNLKNITLNKVIEFAFKSYSKLFNEFYRMLQFEDALKLIDGGSPRYIKSLFELRTEDFIKYPLEFVNYFEFLPSSESLERLTDIYKKVEDFNYKANLQESISRIKAKCEVQHFFCAR